MEADDLTEAEEALLAKAAIVHGDQWVFENEGRILARDDPLYCRY